MVVEQGESCYRPNPELGTIDRLSPAIVLWRWGIMMTTLCKFFCASVVRYHYWSNVLFLCSLSLSEFAPLHRPSCHRRRKPRGGAPAVAPKIPTSVAMPTHVFALTVSSYNHADDNRSKLYGVFFSKEDAVASIPSLKTQIGCTHTFADVFKEGEDDGYDVSIDNRRSPPDNGILLKVEYNGESDNDKVRIRKIPFVATGGRLPKPHIELDDDEDFNDGEGHSSFFGSQGTAF